MRGILLVMLSCFVIGNAQQIDETKLAAEKRSKTISDYCATFPKGAQLSVTFIGDTLRFKEVADDCDGRKSGLVQDWIKIKRH